MPNSLQLTPKKFLPLILSFLFMGFSIVTEKTLANAIAEGSEIKEEKNLTVVYFSEQKKEQFETKVKPFFESQTAGCKACAIVNFTPYNSKDEVDLDLLIEKIKQIPDNGQILFFDWNERKTKKNQALADSIKKLIESGKVVIAATGVAQVNNPVLPLSSTLFGTIDNAIIVGELEPQDVLKPQSYFGPQMLLAVRPPKELMRQGFGPLIFVSRLANSWQRRNGLSWVEHFKERKKKSKNIWPDIDEFFLK